MKYFNYKNFFLVLLALGTAYLLSSFSIKNVFLADSPRIRPDLDKYLLAKISLTKNNVLAKLNFNFLFPKFNQGSNNNFVANQNREETINFLKNNLKPITKGVSAAEKDGYNYTEFKLNEIEWAQITYILNNGKQIMIQYPKGTEPPPKEIYEE